MNIYLQKRRWKIALIMIASIIVLASLWFTNMLVRQFAENERTNVNVWANAIQRKANLVNYTNRFFELIEQEEFKRAELFAETYKRIERESNSKDITFYAHIIGDNTTIPVILTKEDGSIISSVNVDPGEEQIKNIKDFNLTEFKSININISPNEKQYLYYSKSTIYSELERVLDDLIESFFSEIVENSVSVPVIVTDSLLQKVFAFGNIDSVKMSNPEFVKNTIHEMDHENDPIKIKLPNSGNAYIFYHNSSLLTQIKYYPYVQFAVIGLFFFIVYLVFNTTRKSEQNQVWVGMSKETAHQLGTPLSSMLAWVEILRMKEADEEILLEIENDLSRLQKITERFSKIGSPPNLEIQNIVTVIYDSIEYIKRRASKKINYKVEPEKDSIIMAPINKHLFGWVVENICKNAIDAMNGVGKLEIKIIDVSKYVILDFKDSGKGIAKSNFKTVFDPGYTSKIRGWGLGLTLSKRIIKDYHKGKIFVKSSVIEQGTIFRIVLKKTL